LDEELQEQREMVVNLKINSSSLSKAIEEEKRINQSVLLEINDLQSAVDDTKVDADVATFSLKSYNSILRDLQEEAADLKAQLKKEMAFGDQLEGINIMLDMEADGMRERKEKETEAVKKLEEIKEELSKEKEEFTKNVEEEKRIFEEMVNQKSKWRTSLIDARAQEEAAKTRFAQLEEVMRGKESLQTKVSKRIEPLESKKVYGPPRDLKLEAKVKKYQALHARAEEQGQNMTDELKRAKAELLRLRESVAELKDEVTSTKKKIRQTRDPRRRVADRLISVSGTLKWAAK